MFYLQAAQASSSRERTEDGFSCMSSSSSELCSDGLFSASSEFYSAGMLHPRQIGMPRLPRIDEHVYQNVQASRENECGGRMNSQNLHSINPHCYQQEATSSGYHNNSSRQVPPSLQNHSENTTSQQNFLAHNSDSSNYQSSCQPQFYMPHPPGSAGIATQQNHSQNAYHSNSHYSMERQQHNLSTFQNNIHQVHAADSMDSQQDFPYLDAVSTNHHQQHLQQTNHDASPSNYVNHCESNGSSDARLGFEESPIDGRSDFQREQQPSGNYEPELGMSENPFYFSVNQMLYEAHVSRVRRMNHFPGGS